MFFRNNLLGLLWALVISVLSFLPPSSFPETKLVGLDKLVHICMYGALTFLLIIGFKKQFSFKRLKNNAIALAAAFSVVYGALIEMLQGMIVVNRSMELADIVANAIGCLIGMLIFFFYGKWRKVES